MTASSAVRCDYCQTTVPADQAFQPFRGGPVNRCRDEKACNRRQTRAYDPTIPPDDDLPIPQAVSAPPGAACEVCRDAGPGAVLYQRMPGQWFCSDRGACEQRAAVVDLIPWTDSSPDRWIAETGGHLRLPASAPPQVLAEQTELSHAEIADLAAREALGRKRARG